VPAALLDSEFLVLVETVIEAEIVTFVLLAVAGA